MIEHNPWWALAAPLAKSSDGFRWSSLDGDDPLEIGGLNVTSDKETVEAWKVRRFGTARYAWSVTDPDTVQFVAEHSRGKMIDPIAGTGYWQMLLAQLGVDVISSDVNPPLGTGHENNDWHPDASQFVEVAKLDAVEAIKASSPSRTLFLAWPPYDTTLAWQCLDAYQGERFIFIGEGMGGCTADDSFFELLERDWTFRGGHRPVQFFGIHDYVTAYDRKPALPQE